MKINLLIQIFSIVSTCYAFRTIFPDNIDIPLNVDYSYQNNSIWYPIDLTHNETLYNQLYKYRYNNINCYNSNTNNNSLLKLAYIDIDTAINSTHINIIWKNMNFKSDNSLYIDYYYFNINDNYPYFTETNLGNTHTINLESLFKNFIFSNFSIEIRSNKYNVKTIKHFKHNDVVKIYSNNTHTSSSLCLYNFCSKININTTRICYDGKIYSSGCYLLCSGINIEFKNINMCPENTSSSTTSITNYKDTKNILLNHSNYELVFEGTQSCQKTQTNCRGTRFSTAKNTNLTRHFIINSDEIVEDCITHCNMDSLCKGIYIFYTVDNNLRCRGLSNLGDNIGQKTYQHDYSYKYIGNKHILTTPTTTPSITTTTTPSSTPTTTPSSTPSSSQFTNNSQYNDKTNKQIIEINRTIPLVSNKSNISYFINNYTQNNETSYFEHFFQMKVYIIYVIVLGFFLIVSFSIVFYLKNKKKRNDSINENNNKEDNIYNKLGDNKNRIYTNENYMYIDGYDTTSL